MLLIVQFYCFLKQEKVPQLLHCFLVRCHQLPGKGLTFVTQATVLVHSCVLLSEAEREQGTVFRLLGFFSHQLLPPHWEIFIVKTENFVCYDLLLWYMFVVGYVSVHTDRD